MTFAEAAALDPDREAGELEAGRWVPVTRSTWRHGEVMLKVGMILAEYARAHGGWSVAVGDPGAKLRHDPDVLRGPDVGVIRAERRPTGRGEAGWLEGAPEVAVEIAGDGQAMSSLLKKAMEYLAAGSTLVWVLEPAAEMVTVVTPPNQVRVLDADDVLDGGEALPGFRCAVKALFE